MEEQAGLISTRQKRQHSGFFSIFNKKLTLCAINVCHKQVHHTDISELQLSQACTKKVLHHSQDTHWFWGSGGNPRTQTHGFGALPSSFKRTRTKKLSKRAKFDQKIAVFSYFGFTFRPLDTHGYPGGGGVVYSKDPGQLEFGSASVLQRLLYPYCQCCNKQSYQF